MPTRTTTPRRTLLAAVALGACASLLLAVVPAEAATKSFDSAVSGRTLIFPVANIDPQSVRSARVRMKPDGERASHQLERRIAPKLGRKVAKRKVRRALRRNQPLRVRRPAIVGAGELEIRLQRRSHGDSNDGAADVEDGAADAARCTGLDPGFAIEAAGCEVLFSDTATADPLALWGLASCQQADRYAQLPGTADPHSTITGEPQGDSSYRRLTAFDGDDFWGERCELGDNDHGRDGDTPGPTVLYDEGQRRVTAASFRLPINYTLEDDAWQVVMQMKQTSPIANAGTPVLALEARGGRWRLMQSRSAELSSNTQELWSAPAERGTWTRFAFDVAYSQDPERGSIVVHADLNGDGDAHDPSERSETIRTYTLKREISGGDPADGIAPGESIPSHLRVGVYHNPELDCPPPLGCSVEVDNVQVLGVS